MLGVFLTAPLHISLPHSLPLLNVPLGFLKPKRLHLMSYILYVCVLVLFTSFPTPIIVQSDEPIIHGCTGSSTTYLIVFLIVSRSAADVNSCHTLSYFLFFFCRSVKRLSAMSFVITVFLFVYYRSQSMRRRRPYWKHYCYMPLTSVAFKGYLFIFVNKRCFLPIASFSFYQEFYTGSAKCAAPGACVIHSFM